MQVPKVTGGCALAKWLFSYNGRHFLSRKRTRSRNNSAIIPLITVWTYLRKGSVVKIARLVGTCVVYVYQLLTSNCNFKTTSNLLNFQFHKFHLSFEKKQIFIPKYTQNRRKTRKARNVDMWYEPKYGLPVYPRRRFSGNSRWGYCQANTWEEDHEFNTSVKIRNQNSTFMALYD